MASNKRITKSSATVANRPGNHVKPTSLEDDPRSNKIICVWVYITAIFQQKETTTIKTMINNLNQRTTNFPS